MRVLTATPHSLRQDRKGQVYDTLRYWLESVSGIARTDIYCYLNDVLSAEIPPMFRDLMLGFEKYGYPIDARNYHTRMAKVKGHEYERFAVVRNRVLEYALYHEYDYLFSVDSDLIVRGDSLAFLLSGPLTEITALLVNNQIRDRLVYPRTMYNFGYSPDKKQVMQARGNTFKYGQVRITPYTGACALIDLNFIRAHGIRYICSVNGEDLSFCAAIRAAGGQCSVVCSKEQEAYHIQEPFLIPGIESYRAGATAEDAYHIAIHSGGM
jgi:hypothetical protein